MIISLKPRIDTALLSSVRTATTQTQRITGRRLQAVRERWLAAHPLCVECQKVGRVSAATEVDHIVPLWEGGSDDDVNRQSLCGSCHKVKTAAEAARRTNAEY